MKINGVEIEDTFAEAFPMRATRIIVTAVNRRWALNAAHAATGFATSVIACGCEAGIERELKPTETPDGRPGVSMLLFTMSSKEMAKQVQNRIGQCVRNLFECLGLAAEGAALSLTCGERPDSPLRP